MEYYGNDYGHYFSHAYYTGNSGQSQKASDKPTYQKKKFYDPNKSEKTESTSNKKDLGGKSVSNERGSDGKKNNTSEYNHDYYMHHKDKWNVKTEYYEEGDSDFDMKQWTDENRIGDSDFFAFKDKNGNWVIGEEDMKWKLPEGVTLDSELKKKIASFRPSSPANFEKEFLDLINAESKDFDVDAAAKDVINGKYANGAERKAALGDDYEAVQKRVNEMLKTN